MLGFKQWYLAVGRSLWENLLLILIGGGKLSLPKLLTSSLLRTHLNSGASREKRFAFAMSDWSFLQWWWAFLRAVWQPAESSHKRVFLNVKGIYTLLESHMYLIREGILKGIGIGLQKLYKITTGNGYKSYWDSQYGIQIYFPLLFLQGPHILFTSEWFSLSCKSWLNRTNLQSKATVISPVTLLKVDSFHCC